MRISTVREGGENTHFDEDVMDHLMRASTGAPTQYDEDDAGSKTASVAELDVGQSFVSVS